jgi:type IV pilus assembly protein PilQ
MKNSKFKKYFWLLILIVFTFGLTAGIMAQSKKDPSVPIESLSFQAAEIRSVIRFLADYGNVNVVVAPKVQGQVTIDLKDVTWEQALRIVGSTYGLAIVFEEGYIRVVPADDYRKEQMEQEKHTAEQLTLVQLEVKIVRLANTAAAEIAESVQSLLSPRGKVDADERTNSLILQEIPDNIDRVVSFIKELDKPARQIKISAQLLEIYNTNDLELGVDWTVAGGHEYNADRRIDAMATQDGDRIADPFISFDIGYVSHGLNVDAVVSAIVGESKGRIIAHPEITTIENKEATIQMGQRVPIKQFDESGNVVIQFEDVGTILRVTPHITAENQILMHLKPERSQVQPDPAGIVINTSNAETNVVVNNGQTAVIGGLTSQDEVETVTGIPILKDIPLFGAVFRSTTKNYEDRDLVIFVTPTIIETDLADTGP